MPQVRDETDVEVGELIPCAACCCDICSCICSCPQAMGVKWECVLCCLQSEEVCCKCLDSNLNEDGKCCLCCRGEANCVKVQTCCQMQSQFCCVESRCAFPCTKQVPCIFTFLPFCVCCANYSFKIACCSKVKNFMPEYDNKVAPAQEEMK
mmetsp:Transcript_45867/g.106623  ORF Transcript_45867/g.106623 Transcript_45867/m.106623 type:complete len:151 (+) Transcript_45867:97-549(+)